MSFQGRLFISKSSSGQDNHYLGSDHNGLLSSFNSVVVVNAASKASDKIVPSYCTKFEWNLICEMKNIHEFGSNLRQKYFEKQRYDNYQKVSYVFAII